MSALNAGIAKRSYRPDIDGVRAIAILSVVLCHARAPWITGGFTGVDIFFVISGYLIGGHIFAELLAGRFSYLRFYQRRAKRILPAFYFVLSCSILAAFFLLSPIEAWEFGRSAFAATLSASNLIFWHFSGYFATNSSLNPLLMTWSLGVEEQFYFVIPLLMVLLARIRHSLLWPAILIVCVLSFLLACIGLHNYPMLVFYMLPTRAWELGAGVALAVAELKRRQAALSAPAAQGLALAGMVLMLAPLFLLNAKSPFPGWAALPSVLGTALVIATPCSWVNRRLLSLPPLVFVGRISYSLYLWHWPMLAFLRVANGDNLPPAAAFLAIAAAFAAAVLSYYVIEQPFRRSTRAPGPLLIRYAVVSIFILVVCASVWLSHGLPQRNPLLARIDYESRMPSTDPCLVGHDKLPLAPSCFNRSDARPQVAVWGDSHSAALAPGLRAVANAQGYGLVQLGKSSCLPLMGVAKYVPPAPMSARECIPFNQKVLDLLNQDRRVRIVVLAGVWVDALPRPADQWLSAESAGRLLTPAPDEERGLFRRSLTAAIQSLQQAGKLVIVMEDVPSFDFDPLSRFRTAQIPLRHALAAWMKSPNTDDPGFAPDSEAAATLLADAQLKQALDGLRDVALIDLKPMLCRGDSQCIYRMGDQVFYFDHEHLTSDGARYALREFRFPVLVEPER